MSETEIGEHFRAVSEVLASAQAFGEALSRVRWNE